MIIARDKTPGARLVPSQRKPPKRRLGLMKGEVWLDESFWQPLSEEELKL